MSTASNQAFELFKNYALYFVLLILLAVIVSKDTSFLSLTNFSNILTQSSVRVIIALGVAGLIVTQGTGLCRGGGTPAVEHMAHIGHPLVGDALYGGKPLASFARQALHAWQLQLIHPATQQSQVFVAPVPSDLLTLAAELQIALPAQPPAASPEGA